MMDADGSKPGRLTNRPGIDAFPVWSPDGSKIAYHSKPLLFAIFLMNATGSDPVNLTNVRTSTDVHPAWSPDGAKIAFTSTRDGTGVVKLTNQPETNFFHPGPPIAKS